MRILLISIVISLGISAGINAQIGGISGSKLTVPDAGTVTNGYFEFEPSFGVNSYKHLFTSEWKEEKLKHRVLESGLQFRVSLGLAEGIELGSSFLSTLNEVNVGAKIVLSRTEDIIVSFTPGIILPASNKLSDDTTNLPLNFCYSAGSIVSLSLTAKSNIDIMASVTYHTDRDEYKYVYCYGAAYGFNVTEKFCSLLELTGYITTAETIYSAGLNLSPGLTYQFNNHLLLVAGFQYDLAGKNRTNGVNYLAAFTMKF